ncbi:MAG TPA: hypothetical protein PLT82_12930 [Candidatus Hydrogenedens sp.]|nr:hypothetical protein [Candidatus Hydrogenedens sp.]HOL20955.1 hypothetical protein [Candidatus Hydrogenedens sp.]HPP60027.1 hypothetical protein [Candidatus Hydrogenedens sp.]
MIGLNNKEEVKTMEGMKGYSPIFFQYSTSKLGLTYINADLNFLRYASINRFFSGEDKNFNILITKDLRLLSQKSIPIGTGIVINNSTIEYEL